MRKTILLVAVIAFVIFGSATLVAAAECDNINTKYWVGECTCPGETLKVDSYSTPTHDWFYIEVDYNYQATGVPRFNDVSKFGDPSSGTFVSYDKKAVATVQGEIIVFNGDVESDFGSEVTSADIARIDIEIPTEEGGSAVYELQITAATGDFNGDGISTDQGIEIRAVDVSNDRAAAIFETHRGRTSKIAYDMTHGYWSIPNRTAGWMKVLNAPWISTAISIEGGGSIQFIFASPTKAYYNAVGKTHTKGTDGMLMIIEPGSYTARGLSAGSSTTVGEFTVKVDSIATASGGAVDAFITVCKGETCSKSTGFSSGDTRTITVSGANVHVALRSVAYGASVSLVIDPETKSRFTCMPVVDLIGTQVSAPGLGKTWMKGTVNERLVLKQSASIPEYKVSFYYTLTKPAPTVEEERPAFRLPILIGRVMSPLINALFPTGQQVITPRTGITPTVEAKLPIFICEATVGSHTITGLRIPARLGLASNQESVSCMGELPIEDGMYRIRMVVDSGKDVFEINEGNNILQRDVERSAGAWGEGEETEEEKANTVAIKIGGSADIGDYTITADSIATASGGAVDAFITVCKGETCSSSTGFRAGDTKDVTVGTEIVSIKLVSVAYGASINVQLVDVTEIPEVEEEAVPEKTCLKASESSDVGDYTIKMDSIATASGGTADVYLTVCKGDTCSVSTSFASGDKKVITVGSDKVTIKLDSVAYGASACVTIILGVEEEVVEEEEEVTGIACAKASESVDNIDGYTVTVDAIATASGGTIDAYLTVCKGATCGASTGFLNGDTKEVEVGSEMVKIKVTSVAYGASVCFDIIGSREVVEEEVPVEIGCMKASESIEIEGYTITATAIATASGGNVDAYMTVCKGATCSAATGFKSGDTKDVTVGSEIVKLKVTSVAYGAAACVDIISVREAPAPPPFDLFSWLSSLFG